MSAWGVSALPRVGICLGVFAHRRHLPRGCLPRGVFAQGDVYP